MAPLMSAKYLRHPDYLGGKQEGGQHEVALGSKGHLSSRQGMATKQFVRWRYHT